MRSVDSGMDNFRRATGAGPDDARLIGVRLDLTDYASIEVAATAIGVAAGAPYGLVHNAGISAAGMVEETPVDLCERMFATSIFRSCSPDQGAVTVDARRRARSYCSGVQ